MSKYDVIVIGSGISGLTSALLFAKKGKKVAVVERATKVAPLLAGFDRKGIHFETGFHYSGLLGKNEAGGFLFKELGIDVPVELCDENGFDEAYLLKSKRVFKIPFGRKLWEQRLNEFFPKEKEGIKKYLDLIAQTIDSVPFLNLHKKKFKNEEFFYFSNDKKTLKDVLDECFSDNEIKSILSFSSVLYGVPPNQVSFVMHCCCSGIMYESAWKIKGGALTLVKIMEEALKKYGVEIFVNKEAVRIEIDNKVGNNEKKVSFSDNSQMLCDICVSSIHPKEFIKIAPQVTYRDKNLERIKNMEETNGFFVLNGFLKKDLGHRNKNIAFLDEDSFLKSHKDCAYINFSDTNPQAVCVVLSVDADEKIWNIPKKEYEEKKIKMTQDLKKYFEIQCPDILKEIEFVEMATPRTMKRYVNYYSTYGIKHSADGANILPITKIPGLFVVGQATVSPGVIGGMVSAFLLDKIIDSAKAKDHNERK